MTASTFTIPKGKSAYAMFPPEVQALIDGRVEAVRDKPWAAAYYAVEDFAKMTDAALSYPALTDTEIGNADANFRLMVTALLERLGVDVKPCSDPFQASIFNKSARKDYRRLARWYVKKVGSEGAVTAQMTAWANEHSDELESLQTGLMIRCGKIEGDGPKSLQETLDEWIEKTRNMFNGEGKVDPLAVGLDFDGSGMLCTTDPFTSAERKQAFRIMTGQQFDDRGFTRIVSVGEVWTAPTGTVRPSESDQRGEGIVVIVTEGEEEIAATIPIERDWESGKGILGKTEMAVNVSRVDFSGM